MKRFLCLLSFLAVFVLAAVSARADIDQTCLRQCVNGGAQGSCVAQCSYGQIAPVKPPVAAPQAIPDNHNVMDTPTPIGQGSIPAPKPPAPLPPVKDYTCFNECLHDAHNSYGWCEERCSKPACLPGGVMCGLQGPGSTASSPAATAMPAASALKPPVPPTR